jgi:hypothetical protein
MTARELSLSFNSLVGTKNVDLMVAEVVQFPAEAFQERPNHSQYG